MDFEADVCEREQAMGITCETIWRESSNYIDGSLSPDLRQEIDEHIKTCNACESVMAGLQNILTLYGDERMAELPDGFSQRLHRRIEANMPTTRRNFFGWAIAFAASVLAVGGIELSRASREAPEPISKHSQHAVKPIPPDMQVVVSDKGRLFHLAACPFIINRKTIRYMTANVALAQGFTPCTRCMSKYL
jgi:Putative zinc-finger